MSGKIRYAYSPALGKRIKVEVMPPLDRARARSLRARTRGIKPFKPQWVQMPWWWLEVLQDASASAHQLALVVLAEEFKRRFIKGDVVLSSEVTKMPHSTGRRAAKELIKLGLIEVEWSGKRAGIVTKIRFTKKIRIAKNG